MPNRTQTLMIEQLHHHRPQGPNLLRESLLGRGFLAFANGDGVSLGSGSHQDDLRVLEQIPGLHVRRLVNDRDRVAAISLGPGSDGLDVATRILSLGEHHVGDRYGGFTGYGPGPRVSECWTTYTQMVWGAKLAVCPARAPHQRRVPNALDAGIGLLVKVLPLGRIASSLSCDGHGTRPAHVSFHFPFDVPWARTVFGALGPADPAVEWSWGDGGVSIQPREGFEDDAVICMLKDIQTRARRLLDRQIIEAIGRARRALLDEFGDDGPTLNAFTVAAERVIERELGAR